MKIIAVDRALADDEPRNAKVGQAGLAHAGEEASPYPAVAGYSSCCRRTRGGVPHRELGCA